MKLASVVSDIMGLSSRDMLEAMVDGETDPEKLAGFARRTMKKKKEELELALRGNMSSHQLSSYFQRDYTFDDAP
ncbi:hypothetical protein [Paenibacillus sp. tmac-D7]|uniref:hypothetical protein n=1 Tax=Paenibacillus TaxID=44249 RepID=UPI00358F806B